MSADPDGWLLLTGDEMAELLLPTDHPVAIKAVKAIHHGDVVGLAQLLRENPGLATARVGTRQCEDAMTRTLLHVVTDWPGHFLKGPETVAALVAAGADVNARFTGPHTETPLQWAASSDDVAVLDALLDHGADIEAQGAVIAGGSALADAVGFGQWKAARRLVERGAQTNLWQAAGLGLMDRLRKHLAEDKDTTPESVTGAFWCACHGGQLDAARHLLAQGADLNWIGYDGCTPLDIARKSEADGAEAVREWLLEKGAVGAAAKRSK